MFADEIGLFSGHVDLADWAFLLALLLFIVAAVASVLGTPHHHADDTTHHHARVFPVGWLVPTGLALVALGLLVL